MLAGCRTSGCTACSWSVVEVRQEAQQNVSLSQAAPTRVHRCLEKSSGKPVAQAGQWQDCPQTPRSVPTHSLPGSPCSRFHKGRGRFNVQNAQSARRGMGLALRPDAGKHKQIKSSKETHPLSCWSTFVPRFSQCSDDNNALKLLKVIFILPFFLFSPPFIKSTFRCFMREPRLKTKTMLI